MEQSMASVLPVDNRYTDNNSPLSFRIHRRLQSLSFVTYLCVPFIDVIAHENFDTFSIKHALVIGRIYSKTSRETIPTVAYMTALIQGSLDTKKTYG